MRKIIVTLLVGICILPVMAQQTDAKEILDKTSETFQKTGGIKAEFQASIYQNDLLAGMSNGSIQVKDEKFVLNLDGSTTWFDGKTQWTYMKDNGEVNITNPTKEEIQELNPYAFLSVYRGAYNYKLGKKIVWKGVPVFEVILTSANQQRIAGVNLYIAQKTYQPVHIVATLKDGTRNEIVISSYQKQKCPDTTFAFDAKEYPNVEVIDLR
ncbi:MAG: hypothetical protein LUH22_01030 [Bacteroides sp.]|nr:hypothetical protein [Bacteroides sp.]